MGSKSKKQRKKTLQDLASSPVRDGLQAGLWMRLDEIILGNVYLILLAVGIILCFIHLHAGPQPGDDAFITYRYVRNIVSGQGVVYNSGERVMGTTTPLYVLTLSLFSFLLRIDNLPWLSIIINTFFNLVAVFFLWQICARYLENRVLALFSVLLYVLNPSIMTYSSGGMETPLYILTAMAALYFSCAELWLLAGLSAGLHFLTRPDGVILVFASFVYICVKAPSVAWKYMMVLTGIVLPWLLFSGYYFGSFVPHSVLAKAKVYYLVPWGFITVYWSQLQYSFWGRLFQFAGLMNLIIPLLLILLFVGFGWKFLSVKKHIGYLIISYPVLYLSVFSLGNPLYAPWYVTPLEPFLILFVASGIYFLAKKLRVEAFGVALLSFIVVSQLFHYNLTPGMWQGKNISQGTYDPAWLSPVARWRQDVREELYKEYSLLLNEQINENTVIALPEIGAFGYYSKGKILDTAGLISPVALQYYPLKKEQMVGNNAIPPRLIYEQMPDYIVTYTTFILRSLLPENEFAQKYDVFKVSEQFDFWGPTKLVIFKKKK
ncbi:MAG: glycosyltransferase family 39 protein [Nitrospirae bacterium]|nr:glycosyltransferase family 39 protein [Nitrospirota bacterium]